MPTWATTLLTKIKNFLISSWKFFAGCIVVTVGFLGSFSDLKQPDVSVEITGIEQISSTTIDITSAPEFVNFRKLTSNIFNTRKESGYSFEDLRQEIERSKLRLAESTNDLEKLRKAHQSRSQNSDETIQNKNQKSTSSQDDETLPALLIDEEEIVKIPSQKANNILKEREKYLKDQEEVITAAEDEVKNYRAKTEKSNAKIIVTAAISNPGSGATSLKPQALLRTDLGQGNYLDINLKIVNYGPGNSEIKPKGTAVLTFESNPISRMSPEDQERFLNFFKNTSPTNLFLSDVQGKYYKSNTIPFAQGIYEQKIYDGLKAYASNHLN